MRSFKPELAASVLLEALFTTDKEACERYGITQKTLQNYRKRLETDDKFSLLFHTKKESFDKAWADEIPKALKKGIRLIADCADEISKDAMFKKNPAVIAAIAGAVKICAEVHLTSKVIDARIARQDRPEGQVHSEGTTESTENHYTN